VDVKQAFHWTREALLAPLAPGPNLMYLISRSGLLSINQSLLDSLDDGDAVALGAD
jgi:hypothetical protein